MGARRWVLGVGVCMALAGCGVAVDKPPPAPEEAQPAPDAGTPPPAAQPPPPEGGTPPLPPEGGTPPPPTDGGTPSPGAGLEGPPTLAPAACVPWTGDTPLRRATACEVVSVYNDKSKPYARELSRYDSDARLLEQRTFLPGGAPHSLLAKRWQNGHEVYRRSEQYPSGSWQEFTWTHDAQGRVQEHTLTFSSSAPELYRYHYGAGSRLERIEHLVQGSLEGTTVYQYNAQGWLESIDSQPSCDRHLSLCEKFTYWPDGRLHTAERETEYGSRTESYDSQGRLADTTWYDFDAMGRSSHRYDSEGRLTRLWEEKGIRNHDSESINTFMYDSNGLLLVQRFAEDRVIHPAPDEDEDVGDRFERTRVTRRVTYLCGPPLAWLEEWDSDEDGRVDARRTYEREPSGRLVRERYTGTPGLDEGPVSRDYRYDCE